MAPPDVLTGPLISIELVLSVVGACRVMPLVALTPPAPMVMGLRVTKVRRPITSIVPDPEVKPPVASRLKSPAVTTLVLPISTARVLVAAKGTLILI